MQDNPKFFPFGKATPLEPMALLGGIFDILIFIHKELVEHNRIQRIIAEQLEKRNETTKNI